MFFGPVKVSDAEGAILAHGLRLDGLSFKKGRYLSREDVEALVARGRAEVTVVRLEGEDMPEDEAAGRIAAAIAGPGTRASAPFTGRANLYAESPGLVLVDAERVNRINLIDEAMTIATLAPYDLVEPRQMLATVKIIPFAAPRPAVEEALAIATGPRPLVRVAPLNDHAVGLVHTRLPGMKEAVIDKTARVLAARIERLGSHVLAERRTDHDAEAVAQAIGELAELGADPILIFGASAITDRRDAILAGLEAAGGTIIHFGMPVDPGNLLALGEIGEARVVGLPGCARSPKVNGFDWVLERLLADIPVGPRDIMLMGVGGLLTEIPSRPQPREATPAAETAPAAPPRAPRITAIVLAAGQSRRMGERNKLLADIGGVSMVRRIAQAALESEAEETIIVTGHEAQAIETALAGLDLGFAHNPDYAEGLSTSLKTGLRAVDPAADGVIVCLGDMPDIAARHLDRLIASFNPLEGRAICVPTRRGKRGNPILWGADFFGEMKEASGDTGAKHLIGRHEDEVAEVPFDDDAIFHDIDTPEALAALSGLKGG